MENASLIFQFNAIVLDVALAESHEVSNSFWDCGSKQIQDNISWGSSSDVDWEGNLVGYLLLS
jgi:hypothetical protein